MPRRLLMIAGIALAVSLTVSLTGPTSCFARDSQSPPADGPSLFAYGWDGFWTGAMVGLASGYVATGGTYQSYEWKTLVLGLGIGALSGLSVGITLAITDASADSRMGWLILRDTDYGCVLGALGGAAVGALVWINDGRAKNVLTGAAIGALIGAGVGVVFGVVEGTAAARRKRREDTGSLRLSPSLLALPAERGMPASFGPAVLGRF